MSIAQDSSTPTWRVLWVFDPDEAGGGFGYTVGLADLGLPELHLSERAVAGDDPDDPWRFSGRDIQGLLNDFAARLVAGELRVGDEFTEDSDAGATKVTFRLEPPVPREQVEAYQASVGAVVVPVRWTLRRPPEGSAVPLTEAYADVLRVALTAAVQDLDLSQLPEQWRPATTPSFGVDQAFGPLTPFVQTSAASVVSASSPQIAEFLNLASLARDGYGPARVLGAAIAQARRVGRTRAMRSLLTEVPALVDAVVGPDADTPRWREIIELLCGPLNDDERSDTFDTLRSELVQALRALLATQLLNDVADPELDVAGRGPWWWSFTGTAAAPDAAWFAPRPTLDGVRQLLGPLEATELLRVAQTHLGAREDVRGEPSRYARVADWLYAQMVTSRAGMPPLAELLAGTPAAGAAQSLLADEVASAHLAAAAATLTAALACEARLHPRGRQALLDVFGSNLPALRDLLPDADSSSA